ncbi:MAG: DUF763 domain-containing protein, partial [Candidatus Diapherotrites archaeon]|nr:DUF763 domain-containing protein [Candidatus Diapherotrites archaeon]
MKTGQATLSLHSGHCPKWLFQRMVPLAKGISEAVISEHGTRELLARLADPYFFQSLACVMGFDWHSSGTTTTACGALKEALRPELGVVACGGKGKASKKTLEEINALPFDMPQDRVEALEYASRMSAKVDNNCIQDGYQLYHHSFFVDERGDWCVVQQGMSPGIASPDRFGCTGGTARRYHWLSENVKSFVEDPQLVACDAVKAGVLNMTAEGSAGARKTSVDLVNDNPQHIKKYFSQQKTLSDFTALSMPMHHEVLASDLSQSSWKALQNAYELQPQNYEELVSLRGVGAKGLRALALVSDLVYG